MNAIVHSPLVFSFAQFVFLSLSIVSFTPQHRVEPSRLKKLTNRLIYAETCFKIFSHYLCDRYKGVDAEMKMLAQSTSLRLKKAKRERMTCQREADQADLKDRQKEVEGFVKNDLICTANWKGTRGCVDCALECICIFNYLLA